MAGPGRVDYTWSIAILSGGFFCVFFGFNTAQVRADLAAIGGEGVMGRVVWVERSRRRAEGVGKFGFVHRVGGSG
jgi:hypothetical protein